MCIRDSLVREGEVSEACEDGSLSTNVAAVVGVEAELALANGQQRDLRREGQVEGVTVSGPSSRVQRSRASRRAFNSVSSACLSAKSMMQRPAEVRVEVGPTFTPSTLTPQ